MEKDDDDANINRQQRLVAVVAARPSALDELPPELWQIVIAMLDAEAARGDGVARFARDLFYDSSPAVRALVPSAGQPPTDAALVDGLVAVARNGHVELFRYAMDKYAPIIVGISNPPGSVSLYPIIIAIVENERLPILAVLLEWRLDYARLAWLNALRLGRTVVLSWLRDTLTLQSLRKYMGSERDMYMRTLDRSGHDAFASVRWLHENGMDARFDNLWPAVLAMQDAELREYVYTHKIGMELSGHVLSTIDLPPIREWVPVDEDTEARALETVEWLSDRHAVFEGPLAGTQVPAYGYVSVARLLVQLGMTVNAAALNAALANGRLPMVRWLMEEQHLALDDSPEHVFYAIQSKSPATLAYIITCGAFIDPVRAPWVAVFINNLPALQQLMDANAPLTDDLCNRAVQLPGCKASTLRWLIEHGARFDADELRALVARNSINRADSAWPEMRAYVATL